MLRKISFAGIALVLTFVFSQAGDLSIQAGRLVPKLLNYQGYLTDTFGIPIDDSLDMTFKVFDAASSGNELWSEGQTNVPIERGVFSVILGESTPIPDSVFADFTSTWLELTLEGPQTLAPRTRITSVGYAYTSTYTDTAEYSRTGAADNDWTISGSVLYPSAQYGLSMRSGNVMYGTNDSTHVNFGIACTTGANGQNNEFCVVGGGEYNAAKGSYTTVSGGYNNIANGIRATIGGGYENTASSSYSIVGGGFENTVSGIIATVGGGQLNTASGYGSVVGGGYENTANSNYTVVSGGVQNYADNYYAAVVGGYADTVRGRFGGILSGYSNLAGNALEDTAAIVVGGWDNEAIAKYATVGGGKNNIATNDGATVGGGENNDASGFQATVAGGRHNTASGWRSSVGGGEYNSANWGGATVAGGAYNSADSAYTFIGGGNENVVAGNYSAILGGYADTIATGTQYSYLFGIGSKLTQDSTFMVDLPHIRFGNEASGYEFPAQDGSNGQIMVTDGSGQLSWTDEDSPGNWTVTDSVLHTNDYWGIARGSASNILFGDSVHTHINFGVVCTTGLSGEIRSYSAVSSGKNNAARGNYAVVNGGRYNKAESSYTFVGGGRYNVASNLFATVSGGSADTASGLYATVSGGRNNIASNSYATIAGGWENKAGYLYSTVGGGHLNNAGNNAATVGGGYYNIADGLFSVVCGGDSNTSSNRCAIVGGGWQNIASGEYAVVPGGLNNTASGNRSFAAGTGANAQHSGCFVWADASPGVFSSTVANQFRVRATGGIDFTGNVGIGISNPSYPLHVNGSGTTSALFSYSGSGRAGYIRNNNNDYYALRVENSTGSGATIKGLYVQGHIYTTGGYQTFLTKDHTSFSVQSPENEIVLSGTSKLGNGSCTISFDEELLDIISSEIQIRVIATPSEDCNGLYVIDRSISGFKVKELMKGTSNAAFDWVAVMRITGDKQSLNIEPVLPEKPMYIRDGGKS